MADLDDLATHAVARLRDEVRRDLDADDLLRRIRSGEHAGRRDARSARRAWAVAGAAALVAAGVTGLAVDVGRDGDGTRPVTTVAVQPTGPAVDTSPPSASPSTTPPPDATPATAAPLPAPAITPSAPAITPPSPASEPADLASIVLPPEAIGTARTADAPSRGVELDVPACGPAHCPSIAAGADGWLVVYDPPTQVFTITTGGSLGTLRVEVAERLHPSRTRLVAVGPGQVAYLATQSPDQVDPAGELVAVSLYGRDAGEVLARRAPIDVSGDVDLVPTRHGLVAVACCDAAAVRPDPSSEPLMRWVSRDGTAPVDETPAVRIELHDGTFDVVLGSADGGDAARWVAPVPAPAALRGMPQVSVSGGTVLIAGDDVLADGIVVLRLDPDGGVTRIVLPPSWAVQALGPHGTVITSDGVRTWQWAAPGFGGEQDSLDEVLERTGGAGDASIEALLTRLAETYRTSSCGDVRGEQTTVRAVGADRASEVQLRVRLAIRERCDDAIGGFDEDLTLVRAADGAWRVTAASRRGLCLRGVSGGLCV